MSGELYDVTEFEKSLTQEEVDRFRDYMTQYHVIVLENKRLRALLVEHFIKLPD